MIHFIMFSSGHKEIFCSGFCCQSPCFQYQLVEIEVEVKVTLQLTVGQSVSQSVSQSVCLGVKPTLGLATRYYFLSECYPKGAVLFLWGALSDERTGLQFSVQSLNDPSRTEPVTILYCLI
jgi:hypothetical protein